MNVQNYIKALENTRVIVEGDNCIIKLRKHIANKQPLYLWNTSKMCYVSSLLEMNPRKYKFNILKGEEMVKYLLLIDEKDNISIVKE